MEEKKKFSEDNLTCWTVAAFDAISKENVPYDLKKYVSVHDGKTIVQCQVINSQAVVSQKILSALGFICYTKAGRHMGRNVTPKFYLRGREKSYRKGTLGWADIPIKKNGEAPKGISLTQNTTGNGKYPTGFTTEELQEIIQMNVSDMRNYGEDQEERYSLNSVTAVHISINAKTGKITRKTICKPTDVNLCQQGDAWKKDVIAAITDENLINAFMEALKIAEGNHHGSDGCVWIQPINTGVTKKVKKPATAKKTDAIKADTNGNGHDTNTDKETLVNVDVNEMEVVEQ